jgi:hypothetical protein
MMKTKEEREAEFRKDLQKLLLKHSAELNITDDGKPYGMHKSVVRVEMDGSYDYEKGVAVLPYTEFDL